MEIIHYDRYWINIINKLLRCPTLKELDVDKDNVGLGYYQKKINNFQKKDMFLSGTKGKLLDYIYYKIITDFE